mgnify:FL=1
MVGLRTVSGDTVEYAYDAFGNELSAAETAVYNPYRYVGQYYDSETGLYYLRARYYDPETGRFTQRDSYQGEVNNPQSLNLYAYATNNPVRFLDRFGHMNYLTQTGILFRGILSGVISEIAGLFNIQGYIDMAKAIFSGQFDPKSLLAGLADNHYVYVFMHLLVLSPFRKASNDEVTKMGEHIGGIVYDIAAAMVGAAAAKVLSVLKTTKIGAKIASTLSKAKIKVASTAKNVAARAKAAAKDIRSAFKRGALKKVGHHLFPKYLGGLPKQRLAKMYAWTHRRLHSDLSKFDGGWLYPKKGYTGLDIQGLYTKQAIIDGLTKFYSQPQYSHLLEDFLKEAAKQ